MFIDVHPDFIQARLMDVLKDGLNACNGVSSTIESFPMKEYYLQSLFLKMTGAQEQKMKCICWELATNDYTYRYEYLHNNEYKECSTYKEKNGVLKDLIHEIKNYEPTFFLSRIWGDVAIDDDTILSKRASWEAKINHQREGLVNSKIKQQEQKGRILTETAKDKINHNIMDKPLPEGDFECLVLGIKRESCIKSILSEYRKVVGNSIIADWDGDSLVDYDSHVNKHFRLSGFATKKNELLDSKLQSFYTNVVYRHRNRCAHNTTSYQQNIPSLDALRSEDQKAQNYFFRFTLLILIDEIFIRLYAYYRKLANSKD